MGFGVQGIGRVFRAQAAGGSLGCLGGSECRRGARELGYLKGGLPRGRDFWGNGCSRHGWDEGWDAKGMLRMQVGNP